MVIRLNEEPIREYLQSNIILLRWLISEGYEDEKTLERRAQAMESWLENPVLMEADDDAGDAAVIEIDLNEITEPLLACPNDPDDIKPLELMLTVDKINSSGIGKITFAAQGIKKTWSMKRFLQSPRYLTNWQEMPTVK